MKFSLKKDLTLGAATAATQIEGGDENNNWARFGLVRVDYETQTRTVNNSGKLYADIIKNRGVTDEAYEKYVKPCAYHK